jgi:predicted nucleic acid-binding protein
MSLSDYLLAEIRLVAYPHDILLPRVWELLAVLTAYDTVCVALAQLGDAPLLTCDRKIALASGRRATVEVV